MAHPLWDTQVELERGMLRAGADRVRDRVAEAKRARKMTRLDPVRNLMSDWLPKVADGLTEWRRAFSTTRGPKPIALALLAKVDPYVASLVTLRIALDGITIGRPAITGLAVEIGRTVEHEIQVRLWEATETQAIRDWKENGKLGEKPPALFRVVQERLRREGASASRRARVNVLTFNSLLAEGRFGAGWTPWTVDEQFRVGVALLENLVRVTGWFTFAHDPDHVHRQGAKSGPKLVLAPKPGLTSWLAKTLDREEVLHPAYAPTVVPPKRWEGTRSGGYWTPYVRHVPLVRQKAAQFEGQRDRAADDYEALDMPAVYDAIHFLQEVPWRVNDRIFRVMQEFVTRGIVTAGVPLMAEGGYPLPERPAGMPEPTEREAWEAWKRANPQPARAWKRKASEVYRRNVRLVSSQRAFGRTFGLAQQYREFPCFYFPHMMDFRGRMYPIPVGLQPQGDDVARGLLEFADGLPCTAENDGGRWLAIHLANLWGIDKVPFEERLAWTEERHDQWRRIAADPVGTRDEWAEADKPWQALAAILDYVAFLEVGFGYVSHVPVAVDGTCNGIQHLAAMTRDEVAGAYVNLVPSDEPQDIYKFVARELQYVLERIEASGGGPAAMATYWLDLFGRDIPRSFTKRQVMVLPYGGTKDSFYEYTRQWLNEHAPLAETEDEEAMLAARAERSARLTFIVNHLWDAVGANIRGPRAVMEWLQACAKPAMRGNQPILWAAPTGFVARHFYGKQREKIVDVLLDGQRARLTLRQTTPELDTKAQLRGIAPNFVHAQDAAALTLSILKARGAGIEDFTAVHDAYGTHAANMWPLFHMLREAFVEVHEADPLGGFRAACQRVLVDLIVSEEGLDPLEASEKADGLLPPVPEPGALNLGRVADSLYFFA